MPSMAAKPVRGSRMLFMGVYDLYPCVNALTPRFVLAEICVHAQIQKPRTERKLKLINPERGETQSALSMRLTHTFRLLSNTSLSRPAPAKHSLASLND